MSAAPRARRRARGLVIVLASFIVVPAAALSAQATPPAAPAMPNAPAAPPARDTIDAARFPAQADAATPQAVAQSGDRLTAFYAVPEMPAGTILGVTPAAITRPITPKDFASSLLNGIDADGRVRQGLVLEASLGLTRAFRVPLATYQASRRARFWSNLLVSFATVRVASDTNATDLAWGVRAPLYDDGDALARPAYTRRLGAALLTCAPDRPPLIVPRTAGLTPAQIAAADIAAVETNKLLAEKSRAEQLACLEDVATETGKAAADSLWNATRLILAYAGSTRLPRSTLKTRQRLEDRVWLVGAIQLSKLAGPLPFARSSQLVGYAGYVRTHAIDTIAAASSASFGGRLNVGSASLNGFGEILGEWRDKAIAGAKRTTTDLSAGIEFLAAPGTWLSTGIGRRYSDVAKTEKTVLLANIQWGIASKPFLSGGVR